MNLYEFLLAVHILMAVIWVGGAFTNQILAIRAQRSGDPQVLARFAGEAEWVGMRVFLPASIVLLLAGIWLEIEGDWGFERLWILLGIAGFAFSVLVGSLYLGPESGRIKALMDERGPEDAEVNQRISKIFLISRIELVILLLIVLNMAIKPGS